MADHARQDVDAATVGGPGAPRGADRQRRSRDDGFRPAFPLVEGKLHPRASHQVTIRRPRLIDRLMAEPRPPIVSVCAPPGYGKTVLLAEWVARETRPVAWLTLDELDNDPSVFLTYLAAAIDRVRPVDPSMRAAVAAPTQRVLATAVPRLATELHRWTQPGLIVLDDAHRLTDSMCLDALSLLLTHLPPGFQAAISTRHSRALPLGRFRAYQQLLDLGREDLALDPGETRALASAMGVQLDDDAAVTLREETEGWAAAIYLACLERARRSTARPDPSTGQGGYIAEFIRSELARDVAHEDIAFLVRTSILEYVEPEVAEAISGMPGAARRLRALADTNELVTPVAAPKPSYRYHTLLREYLRAELVRESAGASDELHRRAAAWYSGSGRVEQAVEHALAGGDQDEAARLLTPAAMRIHYSGQDDRLTRWFGSFDEAVFERNTTLAMLAVMVLAMNGRPGAAERVADLVERVTTPSRSGDRPTSAATSRAILRVVMARQGVDVMLADVSVAAAAEGPGSPWRMFAYLALGWARRLAGDPAAADAAWVEAISSALPGTNVYLALASRAALAMARDDRETAARLAIESHDAFGSTHLGDVAPSLLVHAVAARAAFHAGDLARGRSELVHAQLARPQANHALPWIAVAGMLELARAYLTVSDVSGARSVVADAARIIRLRPGLGVLVTELAELKGRLADASETLMGSSTLTPAELRLLPFLPTYLSFEEIATRLQVSRHTIKTHAMAVYAKLQASSRSQAVERAVELGMIEPFPGLPVPSASLDPGGPHEATQVPAHVRGAPRHPGHEAGP